MMFSLNNGDFDNGARRGIVAVIASGKIRRRRRGCYHAGDANPEI